MKMTVAQRINFMTASVLLGVILLSGLLLYQMDKVYERANTGNTNIAPSLVILGELRRNFLQIRVLVRDHILSPDPARKDEIEITLNHFIKQVSSSIKSYELNGCQGVSCIADDKDKEFINQIEEIYEAYLSNLPPVLKESRKGREGMFAAHKILLRPQSLDNGEKLIKRIEDHIKYNIVLSKLSSSESLKVKQNIVLSTIWTTLGIFAMIAFLGLLTQRGIMQILGGDPLVAQDAVKRIANGDLEADSILEKASNESLLGNVRMLINYMKRLAIEADAVGSGDFNRSIETLSERDRLGNAFNNMIVLLRKAKNTDDGRNWLSEGKNQLSTILAGDISIDLLAELATSTLCRYLNTGRGVLYNFNSKNETLNFIGAYMSSEQVKMNKHFKLGEGTIGQVAREKKPIILKTIDSGTTAPIVTGTTCAVPLYTYTYPLVHEDNLLGVLEIASFEHLDKLRQDFLESATELIVSFLYIAKQREDIRELLVITENARREAQEQGESLQVVNTQLEEQQQQLQQQSTELQTVNAQLEEQQQQLEIQTKELQTANIQMEEQQQLLEQRNHELLHTQEGLNLRARQLELTSKYKSEFLANMSHELRTPLNSIILLAKMMASNEAKLLSEEHVKHAQVMHNAGHDLLRLINGVLDLSKVEAGKMELFSSSVATKELSRELNDLFTEQVRNKNLVFSIEDTIMETIVTDRDKFSQILRNLLSNAIKFTRSGKIIVAFERRTGDALPLRFSVTDTGIGIPLDKQTMIFEAFHQIDGSTSREFGGTGLGLSISLSFARLMGGTIDLNSEEGIGSTFTLLLPENPPMQLERPLTSPLPPVASTTINISGPVLWPVDDRENLRDNDQVILLIDDDPNFAQSIVDINRHLGHKTLLASRGSEGLELVNQYHPNGILLDLGLPDMDGLDVLHRLKSSHEHSRIPVYIVSARDHSLTTLRLGALGCLQKPVSSEQIVLAENLILDAFNTSADQSILLLKNGFLTEGDIAPVLGENRNKLVVLDAKEAITEKINEILSKGVKLAIIDLGIEEVHLAFAHKIASIIHKIDSQLTMIFYSSKPLSEDINASLRQYSDIIIIKTPLSEHRLKENIEKFLKQVPKRSNGHIVSPSPVGSGSKRLSGRSILVVDDDPRNLFVITAALEKHGANVNEALNGRRALEKMAYGQPDLVIMDIMMPEMDGHETIKAMRADPRFINIPVIALTAKASPVDREKALFVGADDYLAKPADYNVLINMAAAWSKGRR